MDDGTYVIVCAVLIVVMLIAIPIRVKSKAVSVRRSLTAEVSPMEEGGVVAQLDRKLELIVAAGVLVITAVFLVFGYTLPRDDVFEFEARWVILIAPTAFVVIYSWRTSHAYKVARRVESEYARTTKGHTS